MRPMTTAEFYACIVEQAHACANLPKIKRAREMVGQSEEDYVRRYVARYFPGGGYIVTGTSTAQAGG